MARRPTASRGPFGFLPSHRVERGWRGQMSFRPRRRTSIRRRRRPWMVPTLGRTTRGPRRPPVPVEDRAPPAVEDPRIPNGRAPRSLRRDQRGITTPLLPVPIARQQAAAAATRVGSGAATDPPRPGRPTLATRGIDGWYRRAVALFGDADSADRDQPERAAAAGVQNTSHSSRCVTTSGVLRPVVDSDEA
jgi:hypothetical protein